MSNKPKSEGIGCLFYLAIVVFAVVLIAMLTSCSSGSSNSGCHWELEKAKSPFTHEMSLGNKPSAKPKLKKAPLHNSRTGTRKPLSTPAKPTKKPKAGYVWEYDCD